VKTLDKYLQGQLWTRVLFGFLLFLIFTLLVGYTLQLVKLYGSGAPLEMVANLFLCRVVMVASMCLPMGMLLSALLVFGRLSNDGEIVAFQASGIPVPRVLANAYVIGALLTVGGLALNEFAVPWAGEKMTKLETQIKLIIRGRLSAELNGRRAFMVPEYDEHKRLVRAIVANKIELETLDHPAELTDVTYIQYDDHGQATIVINADRAQWVKGAKWIFYNPLGTTIPSSISGNPKRIEAESIELEFHRTPPQMVQSKRDLETLSIRDTWAMIKELKGGLPAGGAVAYGLRVLQVGLHRKLAIPAAAFVFALIGAPLAIRDRRGGTALGIGLSLLIIALYYIAFSVTVVMGENGQLPPALAGWFADGVGLLVGAILTWKAAG